MKAGELVQAGAIGRVIQTVGLGPHRLKPQTRPAWFFERARTAASSPTSPRTSSTSSCSSPARPTAEIVASQVGNLRHPEKPGLRGFRRLRAARRRRHRLHPCRLVHAGRPADLGRRAPDHPRPTNPIVTNGPRGRVGLWSRIASTGCTHAPIRPNRRRTRPVSLTPGFARHAEGSCLIRMGNTEVLCAASVEGRVPPFLRNSGQGWVTAEYGMLPRATHTRGDREAARGKQSGRTQEIQRLIGRALRAVVDRTAMGEVTVTLDCDVLNADGGTRCAAITGAWVALSLAFRHMLRMNVIKTLPLIGQVAAVSCGIAGGEPVLDLDYAEDFVGRGRRQFRADRRRRHRGDPGHRRARARSARRSSSACWASPAKASRRCSRRSARRSARRDGAPARRWREARPGQPQPGQARRTHRPAAPARRRR